MGIRNLISSATPELNTQTQKASGINALERLASNITEVSGGAIRTGQHLIFSASLLAREEGANIRKILDYPIFARPCPVVPKHGFVDSRTISSEKGLQELAKETLKEDKDADIAIAKKISAAGSAIMSGGALSVGTGHDGVTSAHGVTTTLPIIPFTYKGKLDNLQKKYIKSEDETLFWELVYPASSPQNPYLVQVRPGPNVNFREDDYLPEDLIVKHILRPDDVDLDLLAWAKHCEKWADKPGTAINIPNASLASHFAIHGITNDIPVVTSQVIKKDQFWAKNSNSSQEIDDEEVRSFFKAVASGTDHALCNYNTLKSVAMTTLYGVHSISALLQEKDYKKIAITIAALSKIGALLSLGELRYYKKIKFDLGYSRHDIYCKFAGRSLHEVIAALDKRGKAFADTSNWVSGYGGAAWYRIAAYSANLYNTMANGGTVNQAIQIMNEFIHLSHNGGKFMDKILGSEIYVMDVAADNPTFFAIAQALRIKYIINDVQKKTETLLNYNGDGVQDWTAFEDWYETAEEVPHGDLPVSAPSLSLDKKTLTIKAGTVAKPLSKEDIYKKILTQTKVQSIQIRRTSPSSLSKCYRLQIKYTKGDSSQEIQIEKDYNHNDVNFLTSQTWKLTGISELLTGKSHYDTPQMYLPLDYVPNVSSPFNGWFGVTHKGKFLRVAKRGPLFAKLISNNLLHL